MKNAFLTAVVALAACAPSVSRRQCEFIATHGPAAVAQRYDWAGYYDCQGNTALVPYLALDHLDLGVFDFRKGKVTQLLGHDDGGSTIGGSKRQWILSPNEKYAIWVEVQLGGTMLTIGPRVRIYPLGAKKAFIVKLPPRTTTEADGMDGTWQFEGFSKDGNEAIFYLFGKDKKAIINLPKAALSVVETKKSEGS